MDATTTQILIVAFFATLIRSTFGFGEAVVAVPMLSLIVPIRVAAPIAVMLSITVALIVVVQDTKHIQFKSIGWLLLPTFFGLPLGLWVLTHSSLQAAKIALGSVIVLFSGYCIIGKRPPELKEDHRGWQLATGFVAGFLGGAFGMNGPALVVYGSMRRWSAQEFRATLQGYFLPASFVGLFGFWLKGLWTPEVTHYYLISLFVAIPAVFIGRELNKRLKGEIFLKTVHGFLATIGAIVMVQALRGK